MGLVDRLAEATRPTNSLREATGADLTRASPAPAAAPAAAKKPANQTAPDPLAGTYCLEDTGGERRYYEDYRRRSLALRAGDSTISSKREDLATIRAMLALAEARGWTAIALRGSADFRREAWIEAQARGLDTQGYNATALDRQKAGRHRAERQPSNGVHPAASGSAARPDPVRPAPPDAGTTRALPKAGRTPDAAPPDNPRKALRATRRDLSPDGRLVLAALSETIDRQMSRFTSAAKADLKRFVAAELLKTERTRGPVVLTAAQARAVSAPAPARAKPDASKPLRHIEPDSPHRSRSR